MLQRFMIRFQKGNLFVRDDPSRGGVLVGAVVTMVIMGALGAGMVSMLGTATVHEDRANYGERAYYLAESGFRYAVSKYRRHDKSILPSLNNSTVNINDGGSFSLKIQETTEEHGYVDKVTILSYDAKGGNLQIAALPPGKSLPEFGGMISVSDREVRYLKYMDNTLYNIQYDDTVGPLVLDEENGENTYLVIPIAKIISKGTFPGDSNPFSVDRTIAYWWPMSGGVGVGGPVEVIPGTEYATSPLHEADFDVVPGKSKIVTDTYSDPVLGLVKTTDLIFIDYYQREGGGDQVRYMWTPFKHETAGVDLQGAQSVNAGYLSYEIQAKISISRPLEYASGGIGFRIARTNSGDSPDYSGYVISFMRHNGNSLDYIPRAVKAPGSGSTDRQKLLLVLWEQTGNSSDLGDNAQRRWLAYAEIEGNAPNKDSYVMPTNSLSDGFIIQHLSSMVVRVIETNTVSGRTNRIQVFFGDPNPDNATGSPKNPYGHDRTPNANPYDLNYLRAGYLPAHEGNEFKFDIKWPSLPSLSAWQAAKSDYFSATGGDPLSHPAIRWKAINENSSAALLADDRGELTVIQDPTHTTGEGVVFLDNQANRPEIAFHGFGDLRDEGPRRRMYIHDVGIRLLKGDGSGHAGYIAPIQQ